MTEQQKTTLSSPNLFLSRTELGIREIPPRLQHSSVFTLIDEPTYVADIDSLIANWVHHHHGSPEQSSLSESATDDRPTVKRIWEALNYPDRPNDSASVDQRIQWIRYLEKLLKKQISNTADLRQHLGRYLAGYDGRRLPVGKALKKARKQVGLSQQGLADLLGLRDHTLISKYESGKRVPPDKVLEWLGNHENVTGTRRGKGNSRTPSNRVTSSRGNEAPISPDLAKSVTPPTRPECPPDDSPSTPAEGPAQLGLFPPTDPQASPISEGPSPSTEEAPNA